METFFRNVYDMGKNSNHEAVVDFSELRKRLSEIKGIGEKTAMKLLSEYGHLEQILEYCKANPNNKTNQKIIAGEEDALFFKSLANIYTDLDMKEDYDKSLYHHYQKSKPNKAKGSRQSMLSKTV